MGKIGRNERCPCGSGRKYKRCCWNTNRQGLAEDFAEAFAEAEKPVELTDEERARFERIDRQNPTVVQEEQEDGSWKVYTKHVDGRETVEHYDRHPDAEGATRIDEG